MDLTTIIVTITVAVISSGIFNTILSRYFSNSDKRNCEHDSLKKAARLLMKNEVRSLCIYYINQKWIYEDELEDLMAMHDCYHNGLEGNGFLDELMKKVKSLEVRGIGVK